ncbi:MAG: hypothetical protein IKX28_01905 [Bacteroidales bacterium]|nr:hypothetical protein [Bacteroidales bacterium]
MKKNIFLIGLLLLGLTSCYKSVLDPLKGIFPAPTVLEMTQISSDAAKVDGQRLFTLDLSDGSNTFHATLVGDAYYLTSNAYTEAVAGAARKGNFILGQTSVNGKQVASGTITVTQDGENYTLSAVLFLDDGAPYKVKWTGTIHFDPDPEPVRLTEMLIAQANANGTVTFKLGTEGMSVDAMGTPSGDGCTLTADVYSADGYLHEGVYTAATGDTVGEGQYAPGYEYDLSDWGMGIMHWGTCWWNAGEATHISAETITVEKKGANWVITWGEESTYPHWAVFEGAIEALTPSGAPTPDYTYTETLGGAVDNTFTPVAGVTTHSLAFINKAGEEVAWFDLVLTEGVTDLSGNYTCTEYAHEDHTFGNGYDLSAWGMGMGGSRYLKDGAVVLINPGETLSVSKLAEGIYEFSGNGFDFIVGNGGSEGEEAAYTIADELSDPVDETFAPVSGVKTHNLTLKNADGEECVWFQLVLTEGSSDFEGEYVCKEYAHEDHTFGNGYDLSAWGMGMGGTRYVAADGSVVLVNPGETLTVTKVGDGTFKFVGSTGYSFVGKFE